MYQRKSVLSTWFAVWQPPQLTQSITFVFEFPYTLQIPIASFILVQEHCFTSAELQDHQQEQMHADCLRKWQDHLHFRLLPGPKHWLLLKLLLFIQQSQWQYFKTCTILKLQIISLCKPGFHLECVQAPLISSRYKHAGKSFPDRNKIISKFDSANANHPVYPASINQSQKMWHSFCNSTFRRHVSPHHVNNFFLFVVCACKKKGAYAYFA